MIQIMAEWQIDKQLNWTDLNSTVQGGEGEKRKSKAEEGRGGKGREGKEKE